MCESLWGEEIIAVLNCWGTGRVVTLSITRRVFTPG